MAGTVKRRVSRVTSQNFTDASLRAVPTMTKNLRFFASRYTAVFCKLESRVVFACRVGAGRLVPPPFRFVDEANAERRPPAIGGTGECSSVLLAVSTTAEPSSF